MKDVVNGIRRSRNPSQSLQFPIQLVKVFHRRMGTKFFKKLFHTTGKPCIHLQNIGYFPRFPFLVIHTGVHIFKLMEQAVILRESVMVLNRFRKIPILHQ